MKIVRAALAAAFLASVAVVVTSGSAGADPGAPVETYDSVTTATYQDLGGTPPVFYTEVSGYAVGTHEGSRTVEGIIQFTLTLQNVGGFFVPVPCQPPGGTFGWVPAPYTLTGTAVVYGGTGRFAGACRTLSTVTYADPATSSAVGYSQAISFTC
jgi:hypothetical protein